MLDQPTDPTDDPDALEYRPLCTPAVISLVTAFISPVAFASPLLLVVPLTAVSAGLYALRQISREPRGLSGAGLATAGLLIGVGVAAAVYTRDLSVEMSHTAGAALIGDRFIELLAEGDDLGAIELTLPQGKRSASHELAELKYASDEEAAAQLEGFRTSPPIEFLLAEGAPRPEFAEASSPSYLKGGRYEAYRWYSLPGYGPSSGIRLHLEREAPRAGAKVSWRVRKIDFAPLGE